MGLFKKNEKATGKAAEKVTEKAVYIPIEFVQDLKPIEKEFETGLSGVMYHEYRKAATEEGYEPPTSEGECAYKKTYEGYADIAIEGGGRYPGAVHVRTTKEDGGFLIGYVPKGIKDTVKEILPNMKYCELTIHGSKMVELRNGELVETKVSPEATIKIHYKK